VAGEPPPLPVPGPDDRRPTDGEGDHRLPEQPEDDGDERGT